MRLLVVTSCSMELGPRSRLRDINSKILLDFITLKGDTFLK